MNRSPSASPLRKKPRLSSPTYDALFDEPDSYDHEALDAIELSLSQQVYSSSPATFLDPATRMQGFKPASGALSTDASGAATAHSIDRKGKGRAEPSLPQRAPVNSATFSRPTPTPRLIQPSQNPSTQPTFLPVSMIVSAADLRDETERSPSPEVPPVPNHDNWFAPTSMPVPVAFASASALIGLPKDINSTKIGFSGFTTPSTRPPPVWALPSAAALETAQKKLKQWELEIENELNEPLGSPKAEAGPSTKPFIATREPLKGVENATQPAPPFASFAPASASLQFKVPALPAPRFTSTAVPSRLSSVLDNPLLARSSAAADITRPSLPSPSNNRPPSTPIRPTSKSFTAPRPSQTSKPSTPNSSSKVPSKPIPSTSAPNMNTNTPERMKPLGLTPRSRAYSGSAARPKFVSPFKDGVKPDLKRVEGSQSHIQGSVGTQQMRVDLNGNRREVTGPGPSYKQISSSSASSNVVSLLNPPRQTLSTSGFIPQTYDDDELEIMGIDIALLHIPSISHYLYYRFSRPSSTPNPLDTSTQASYGAETALQHLHSKGFKLATKEWVNNHWSLILWKLIGMVCLEPESVKKRWCWEEVIRQIEYRYTHELASGRRSALRLITAQDCPASVPLILCISDILWTEEHVRDDVLVPAHPVLEVTDGWYKLRAEVDEALARGVRKGFVRTGRKIAVCGAKLESSKKDAMEILEAYSDVHLVLSGNSTKLAPWHAKLGLQAIPFVATLGSLTADGGAVPILDLIVTQVYPVGYLEFIVDDNGEIRREGPRTEKDEAEESEKWQRRREKEAVKLQDALERKLHRLESYADRLEALAKGFMPTDDEQAPDRLEAILDELEECDESSPEVLKTVRGKDAGWLAIMLHKQCETSRTNAHEEIARDLAISFPPRQVRDFRIIRIKDAQTIRKPAVRVAQLTVWDVMSIQMTEGSAAGLFTVGQRYMVSNLIPSQPSAWMGFEEGAEVYLNTTRNSKWRVIN